MLIRFDDLTLVDQLCAHFSRAGFVVERAGGRMIVVTRPDAPTEGQAEREIRLHLELWRVFNPGQEAEFAA
jgi:hypothetical protein